MRDVADASAQSVQDDWVVANAERGENCMMKTFETLVTAMGYRIMLRDVFEEASTGKPCIYDISEFEQGMMESEVKYELVQ